MQVYTHGEIRSDSTRHEMIYANEILTHNKGEYVGPFMGTYCSRKKILVARNQPKQSPGQTGLVRESDPQKLT